MFLWGQHRPKLTISLRKLGLLLTERLRTLICSPLISQAMHCMLFFIWSSSQAVVKKKMWKMQEEICSLVPCSFSLTSSLSDRSSSISLSRLWSSRPFWTMPSVTRNGSWASSDMTQNSVSSIFLGRTDSSTPKRLKRTSKCQERSYLRSLEKGKTSDLHSMLPSSNLISWWASLVMRKSVSIREEWSAASCSLMALAVARAETPAARTPKAVELFALTTLSS